MNIEYTTSTSLLLALGAFLLTAAVIYFTKRYFTKRNTDGLSEKHGNDNGKFSLHTRNKYPELDVFALRTTFMSYGLLVAIGLMIVAFNWTTYEGEDDLSMLIADFGDEIEMETPRTLEPPPPPPPPPPTPAALQIVESDLPDIESVEFEDMSIDADTELEGKVALPEKKATPPPPPPPPPPAPVSKEIFKVVEDMPAFSGCETVVDKKEKAACAEEKLMAFIYENIQYPPLARENNVSGTVVVQFVVEPDGKVSNIKIVRDIGAGCGLEAERVVKLMPAWNPGKQRGRPVRVMFTLPIRFKLA